MTMQHVSLTLALCIAVPALAEDRIQALEKELARLRAAELARLKAENEALKAAAAGVPPPPPATSPGAKDATDQEPTEENLLAGLAEEDAASIGGAGSFGSRLEQLALQFEPFLHAYATFELVGQPRLASGAPNPKAWSFDPRYFNIFVGGTLGPVHAEVQVEMEHATEIGARLALVDYQVDPRLVIRAGVFLVPFGLYNEYYYPEYTRPFPRRPISLVLDQVVPVVWNDVGVQIRGKGELTESLGWNYALYVGNGLNMATGGNPTNFRAMRGNYMETLLSSKTFGGRLGGSYKKLQLGASFNHGAYTDNAAQTITFLGADAVWEEREWGVLCEFAWARVVLPTNGLYHRYGVSLQGHFAIIDWLRVGLMTDTLVQPDVDPLVGTVAKLRLAPVVALYPAPKASPKTSFRLAYSRSFLLSGVLPSDETIYMAQLATAF